MPTFGIGGSHHDTALDGHASQLFELAEFDPPPDGFLAANLHQLNSAPRPVGTTFPPDRPRPCTIISFVNLFHAIEGPFALAHFFLNDPEVVDDFLFRPIHR
jgi:hypothetical protein